MARVDRQIAVSEGTAVKAPCKVATTAAITLSGEQTIDGVAVVENDRVLVKDQADATTNGIYSVSTGNWSRTPDCDGAHDLVSGTRVFVNEGTLSSLLSYVVTTDDPIVVGTSSITWEANTLAISGPSKILGRETAGPGLAEELTLSEVLDFIGSATRGDILYRGASEWQRLAASTNGYFLKTQGAGTDPIWAALSGSGDLLSTNDLSDVASPATARVNLKVQAARGGGPTLINGVFTPSAAAGALTIAIKTLAAADPSASDPVYVVVPDTINGDYDILAITAATSLVISSGSTFGLSNATPFNLHLVGFNDGGTFRLGAMNARRTDGIRTLTPGTLESSTAEGGAGGADAAGTIYTGTAVTTKDFAYLGRLEFPQGITTAGTWTWTTGSTTGRVIPFVPGGKLPGDVVQSRGMTTQSGVTNATAVYIGTNAFQAISPKSAANAVVVQGSGTGTITSGGISCFITLARGGTPIGVPAELFDDVAFATCSMVVGPVLDWPGTTGSTTYDIRFKSSTTTQVNFNSSSDTGALIVVTEVQG
jgi:hypothetical protein